MRFIIFLLFVLLIGFIRFQSAVAQEGDPDYLTIADVMPRFTGCDLEIDEQAAKDCTLKGIGSYLGTIKYPKKAKDQDQQGKVYVRFIVNKDGSVGNVNITRGSGHRILDSTAVAHINGMPSWIPGKHKGEAVRVQYVVPINFKFRDPEPMDDFKRKKKKKKKK